MASPQQIEDTTFDIRNDDIVLRVRMAGHLQSGHTMLFVHALGQAMDCFDRQFSSPLLSRHRLVAFDSRGHGRSVKPRYTEAYTKLHYALDMKNVLMALSIPKCVLVGWSFGAFHIIQYLKHAGISRVSGVIFISALTEVSTPRFQSFADPELLPTYKEMGSADLQARQRAFDIKSYDILLL